MHHNGAQIFLKSQLHFLETSLSQKLLLDLYIGEETIFKNAIFPCQRLKGEMHKKAYELIWLHFFRFFWFLSFFPWKL